MFLPYSVSQTIVRWFGDQSESSLTFLNLEPENHSQIFSVEIICQRSTDEGPRVYLHGSQVWVPMVPNI